MKSLMLELNLKVKVLKKYIVCCIISYSTDSNEYSTMRL